MKGVIDLSDTLIIIFSVMIFVGVAVIAAAVVVDITVDAEVKSNQTYEVTSATEKIINSPCTTETRGVFIQEKLRSGSFNCLELQEVYLNVEERETHTSEERSDNYFHIQENGEVRAKTRREYMDSTRYQNGTTRGVTFNTPVSVKSIKTGENFQATMEVAVP